MRAVHMRGFVTFRIEFVKDNVAAENKPTRWHAAIFTAFYVADLINIAREVFFVASKDTD